MGDSVGGAVGSVGQHRASHEGLAGYAIVGEPLPRTRLGKYRRFLLPELYQQALSGDIDRKPVELSATDRETLSHPLAGQVWDLLNKRYPQRPFGLAGSLQLDLGIDSLEWVPLSLEIERRLEIGRESCRERGCPYV